MTTNTTQELRDEIAQTRVDLGDTVEALAAKTGVKARTKDAIGDFTDKASFRARDARDQTLGLVAKATDRIAGGAMTAVNNTQASAAEVRDSLADGDVLGAARKPVSIAGLAVAAAVVGLVVYLFRRRSA